MTVPPVDLSMVSQPGLNNVDMVRIAMEQNASAATVNVNVTQFAPSAGEVSAAKTDGAIWQQALRKIIGSGVTEKAAAPDFSQTRLPPGFAMEAKPGVRQDPSVSANVQNAVDAFKRAADQAAVQSLVVTVPQSANSSLKRVHQGQ